MKKQLLSLTIIAGMVASASAATILTDFSTIGGGAADIALTTSNTSVSISGGSSELTYKDSSLASTTNIRGRVGADKALGSAVALAQNNNQALFGGVLSLKYIVGGEDVQISSITLNSAFFDAGTGNYKQGTVNASANWTLTFKDSENNILGTWTGSNTYQGNATASTSTSLTGTSFTVDANSEVKLEITTAKTTTGGATGGVFGVDSISMEANAVPEPATAGLGLLGLGSLMLRRRRK